MAVSRMRNEKYAICPLVMAESPKLLHSSAIDSWTRLWGRYHVSQNVFLVTIIIVVIIIIIIMLLTQRSVFRSFANSFVYMWQQTCRHRLLRRIFAVSSHLKQIISIADTFGHVYFVP